MTAVLLGLCVAVTVGLVLIARALDADGPWEPKP